ncbi:class I SAM-dependent methyltransferase [Spirillospora sp. NPDC047279]|uniref:class I SAM-dependent methyltransferase n=1 Tax=Spirillospora sp. NPDC047279 TaxID=3155478 RepID=UPI0033F17744
MHAEHTPAGHAHAGHTPAGHAHDHETAPEFTEEFWEERYSGSHQHVWSGRPNATLVTEAAGLPPGRALDIGCGEGADAVWLAEQGWDATAIDWSATALERAAAHDPGGRVHWLRADLATWAPDEPFDLVTSHYTHPPADSRAELFARLAGMVAPGGTLLIVGHHPSDLDTSAGRPAVPDLLYTPEDILERLPVDGWDVVTAEARSRSTQDHDGNEITIHDSVVRARRSP